VHPEGYDAKKADSKKAGTQVLMFNEHPAEHYDFFKDGHRGLKDGVLLIPGAEMRGFLCYPTQSLKGLDGGSNQEFTDLVCGRDGRLFICHLEERMDWELAGITTEITTRTLTSRTKPNCSRPEESVALFSRRICSVRSQAAFSAA
jgi:hypothetical protein